MLAMYVNHARSALLSPSSHPKRPFTSIRHARVSSPTPPKPRLTLPSETMVLKDHIRQTHPAKLYAFSLSHMRKLAVPPVEIPKTYRNQHTRSVLVSGHNVPFTKAMWDRSKRQVISGDAETPTQGRLYTIHEGVVYD